MLKQTLAVPVLIVLMLAGCSDGGDVSPAATSPAPPSVTSVPRIDGTVAPQNAGSTDPVTIKSNPDPINKIAILRDVRVGAHPEQGGWDRIVFEFEDELPPGDVRYVTSATECGSGEAVRLPGEAILEVRFTTTDAHNQAGQATIKTNRVLGPGNVILESRQSCDFEAHVNWDVGVKSRQRFKVTTLANPTRVVIDVKQ